MKVKMLRSQAHKPTTPEADQRLEGREYDLPDAEATKLIEKGDAELASKPQPVKSAGPQPEAAAPKADPKMPAAK